MDFLSFKDKEPETQVRKVTHSDRAGARRDSMLSVKAGHGASVLGLAKEGFRKEVPLLWALSQ